MKEIKKTAEKAILAIIKEYESDTGVKVNYVDITRVNHVGFSHDGARPVKDPKPSKAVIKGNLK
ncbi:MAG: hypothetical protein JRC86_04825 [Deltaproteobacteria bacterium]|nr:hypothetical protein [Deltaproteobacteria bacterium]